MVESEWFFYFMANEILLPAKIVFFRFILNSFINLHTHTYTHTHIHNCRFESVNQCIEISTHHEFCDSQRVHVYRVLLYLWHIKWFFFFFRLIVIDDVLGCSLCQTTRKNTFDNIRWINFVSKLNVYLNTRKTYFNRIFTPIFL